MVTLKAKLAGIVAAINITGFYNFWKSGIWKFSGL